MSLVFTLWQTFPCFVFYSHRDIVYIVQKAVGPHLSHPLTPLDQPGAGERGNRGAGWVLPGAAAVVQAFQGAESKVLGVQGSAEQELHKVW